MSYLFPAVFMTNSLAMTALLIVLGLAGETIIAADIGLVQGATLALFYALSANARNLILNKTQPVSAQSILIVRILLLVPIMGVSFWLSTSLSGVNSSLAVILILRRSVEWLGEVHLSEMERTDNRKLGRKYLITQSLLLIAALSWILGGMPFALLGLFVWAVLPLWFSILFIRDALRSPLPSLQGELQKLIPHVGSTTVIGVTVFVFRLLIVLIVGKAIAGDLFTAFALGGVLGSVFASALGPSIALYESRNDTKKLPSLIRLALYASIVIGGALFIISVYMPNTLNWVGKSGLFWKATSLSMIGGVVMVYAQIVRNRFLQQHDDSDVFGPDILSNILVIAAVPIFYYLMGSESMAALYLVSAVFAFAFYKSCEMNAHMHVLKSTCQTGLSRIVIAVMLLSPVFFQVSNGIFGDPAMIYNTGGILTRLPIPLSVLACFGGILILGTYRLAFKSLIYIFSTFILIVVSIVVSSHDLLFQERAKLIVMIQFILPMFGLVLGEIYDQAEKNRSYHLEKAFLITLMIVIPLQISITWFQGKTYLSPQLYVFSIYQHLQYVPVIFVSAYLIAFYALWQFSKQKIILLILSPLMAIYVAASLSMLAILLLLAGVLVFAVYKWKVNSESSPLLVFLVMIIICGMYLYNIKNAKFTFLDYTSQTAKSIEAPANVRERMVYWTFYIKEITNSTETFFLGHVERPDRSIYPSAYNYYLDFIYSFGFIAILPMFGLMITTLTLVYTRHREIISSSSLLGLTIVVCFLIFADNSMKVGFRQPYPGVFSFFLWGILLRRLSGRAGTNAEPSLL